MDESLALTKFRAASSPVLSDEQIAILRPFGTVRPTQTGDVLFEVGDRGYNLVVVLSGRTEIIDRSDGLNRVIKETGTGEFAAELGLLTGQTVFAACVVSEPGEVLLIPPAAVQEIVETLPILSDLIVTAFAARRLLLMRSAAETLALIGPQNSPGVLRIREFAARNRIPHHWQDPDDPATIALLQRLGATGPAEVWVVVRGQKALADPSLLLLAKVLGLDLAIGQNGPADLVIVGTGPAGLSAAVYGASEGLTTIAVDDVAIGGQAGSSSRIENYLGFPTGISGGDLAFRAEVQALKFGARITVPRRATRLICRDDGQYAVVLDDKTELLARSVVIATGARYRRLGLPRQEQFEGAGIYYAATEVEARLCRKAEVIVVGGGNSAGQAAMYLAETAPHVHLLYRGPSLDAGMSRYLVSRLEREPNVSIHTRTEVTALHGERELTAATITCTDSGSKIVPARAVFVMIGADPRTDWLHGAVELDERGFIVTGRVPPDGALQKISAFQTSLRGVFAAGDVRDGSVKRVASAVGEGSVVVSAVHRYLSASGSR